MSAFVADTHAVIWYVLNQKALSANALAAFDSAAQSGDPVYFSTISIVEICYLVEKGRLSSLFADRLDKALASPKAVLVTIPVTLEIPTRLHKSRGPLFRTCRIASSRPRPCTWACL
jgi:PIN domain nuclease of toxin-antitoxin system